MFFPKWMRKEIGKKRGWRCELCNRSFWNGWLIEVHHIIATSRGGKDVPSNALLVCTRCHLQLHVQMARDGTGHPASPHIVRERLRRTRGGRTRKWIRENT